MFEDIYKNEKNIALQHLAETRGGGGVIQYPTRQAKDWPNKKQPRLKLLPFP